MDRRKFLKSSIIMLGAILLCPEIIIEGITASKFEGSLAGPIFTRHYGWTLVGGWYISEEEMEILKEGHIQDEGRTDCRSNPKHQGEEQ